MAEIEARGKYAGDKRIVFASNEASRKIRKDVCGECLLNVTCSGPDDKTHIAEIYDTLGIKHTDEQIQNNASCLKEMQQDRKVEYFINNHYPEIANLPPDKLGKFKNLVLEYMRVTGELGSFLHPDGTGRSADSFDTLFGFPTEVLTSIVRKFNKTKYRL